MNTNTRKWLIYKCKCCSVWWAYDSSDIDITEHTSFDEARKYFIARTKPAQTFLAAYNRRVGNG